MIIRPDDLFSIAYEGDRIQIAHVSVVSALLPSPINLANKTMRGARGVLLAIIDDLRAEVESSHAGYMCIHLRLLAEHDPRLMPYIRQIDALIRHRLAGQHTVDGWLHAYHLGRIIAAQEAAPGTGVSAHQAFKDLARATRLEWISDMRAAAEQHGFVPYDFRISTPAKESS